jgi:hypothetical protein
MAMPMMKCGHVAQGTKGDTGKPVCVICIGIDPGAEIIDENPPDLTGRMAKCRSCDYMKESKFSLAFFEYRPDREYDLFYCGCRGWG